MKKSRLINYCFALVFLLPGCNGSSDKNWGREKKDAGKIFAKISPVAESWLQELDYNGYSYLTTLKISELLKKEVSQEEILKFGQTLEKEFGPVKERKFFGAHFWIDHAFLSYVPVYDKKIMERLKQPEAKDGFYKIDARYMGLRQPEDMFKTFPDGNYVILMYTSVPTNKPEAGEAVIFWQDKSGQWKIVSYKLAVDL
jgi:hypothetical protein